ncbi:hypothetical protein A5677_03165 [Mycobacterium malmoense]|uniref:PPE family protein n=1 Tax=Mycobacterium malmoense TaxID=1780 RepID=A0A1B9D6H3_MYCMA|nr:PPE family protein [Mycobacterium malmoense]OCB51257.1 hypothetical protein A5677_03165 [Mycobacterium malmoense]
MDFGALPPEVNSGRMYLGPGPATLLAASAAWESLALELISAAAGYESVITTLTQDWTGPTSMSMAAAAAPYLVWLRATAELCEQSATQATAAAAAYEAAYAMTVPPPLIAANRTQLMALIATNVLGQNTPAIMATEAQYGEMWAQDATAMYTYAASSASASAFSAFAPPPQTTNPGGLAGQAGAVTHATATRVAGTAQTASGHAMSVSQALQSLSTPGSTSSPGLSQAAIGTEASLGTTGASTPLSALSSLTGASGKSATKSVSTGAGAASSLASAVGGAVGTGDAAGLFSDVAGLGSDAAGFGADGGGIGIDLYGLGLDYRGLDLDYRGLALDMEGAGSILGAEGLSAPQAMGGMTAPNLGALGGLGEGASASLGQGGSLGTLSVPPGWANAASSVTPLPAAVDAHAVPGGWGAAPAPAQGISKLPLGGMVGRESDGAVHRIGFRPSLIPHSPVAG